MNHQLPVTLRRLVLCRLCHQQLTSTRDHAWYDAVDHLLDEHREQVRAHPERVRTMVSIAQAVGRQTAAELFRRPA